MEDHFWCILETDLSIEIPNFIKNSLHLCGFGNAISLKDCSDEDISDIAKFMREEWAPIMEKKRNEENYGAQMLNYFGAVYMENPTQFEFKSGDKKTIKGLVSYVHDIVKSGGDNSMKHFKKNSCANASVANSIDLKISKDSDSTSILDDENRDSFFLEKLRLAAKRNENRKKGGYRYEDDIKSIALYLRLLAGPLAYDTIQRNMDRSLPSLSSTNRYIRLFGCNIVEGVVRGVELQKYLNIRKLPPVVCLSLDETRIEDEVQYDSKTNQIVGFTLPLNKETGLPIPSAYPARNAEEILRHFSIKNSISSNLNVVMAQPLAQNVPPFCLLAYGTDKRYNSIDVSNQWDFLKKYLASLNIKVLTISSDSDTKYNAAMRHHAKLGIRSASIPFNWFSSAASNDDTHCIQDPEHIGTKLRSFLLRTMYNQRKLPFGQNNYIQIKHLFYIMDNYKKDRHELTNSVLNPVDKQNFKSVMRMCSKKVTDLLKCYQKFHPTMHFLETIRDVIDAFRDKKLTPIERVKKMWFRIFLLRLWRRYILRNPRFTLEKNFLTTYTYNCIELNAHSLVQIILFLQKTNRPEMFLPHLFGSQQCESIFRQMRSLSSTYSTVINCSTKEALARLSKIQIQNDIMHSIKNFKFPRLESKNKERVQTFPLPSSKEIVEEIEKCAADAIAVATEFKFITEKDLADEDLLLCKINPYTPPANVENELKSKINIKPLKVSDFDGTTIKNFPSKNLTVNETGPYVELRFDNTVNPIIVRKSTFVWLLRKEKSRMSSDRLRRVQCTTRAHRTLNRKKTNRKANAKKVLNYPYKILKTI